MSIRRAMKRSKMLTLYHFTPSGNVPAILENGIYPRRHNDDDPMLPPSTMSIWLTSDANGNQITDECVSFYRRKGVSSLIAQVESGQRKFAFGSDGKDSARLTVQIPRKFSGLWKYSQLVTEMYRDWPKALGFLTEMPCTPDWWVIIQPAIAESWFGIGPRCITEIAPVGEETAAYLEAVRAIQDAA